MVYDELMEFRIDAVSTALERKYPAIKNTRWHAIKLLEGDDIVAKALKLPARVSGLLDAVVAEYEGSSDLGDRETLIADSRYQYIEKVVAASVVKGGRPGELTFSEKVDKVVTHRLFAIPLFLLTMLLMFVVTFGPFGSWLYTGFQTKSEAKRS